MVHHEKRTVTNIHKPWGVISSKVFYFQHLYIRSKAKTRRCGRGPHGTHGDTINQTLPPWLLHNMVLQLYIKIRTCVYIYTVYMYTQAINHLKYLQQQRREIVNFRYLQKRVLSLFDEFFFDIGTLQRGLATHELGIHETLIHPNRPYTHTPIWRRVERTEMSMNAKRQQKAFLRDKHRDMDHFGFGVSFLFLPYPCFPSGIQLSIQAGVTVTYCNSYLVINHYVMHVRILFRTSQTCHCILPDRMFMEMHGISGESHAIGEVGMKQKSESS